MNFYSDIIFYQVSDRYDIEDITIQKDDVSYFRPTSLSKLVLLKNQYPHAKLVVGNTEVGKFHSYVL